MRKKRRACSSLAPSKTGGLTAGLPDRSMQQYSINATMSGVAEQRLETLKPTHSDESLAELFALIESNPCLWKSDSKNFKNVRLKRRLWDRFAVHLQKYFPQLGPFTADNLRYVYSIKRRQYYDELKDKTGRTETGDLEYTGRWKFFDCLSFLRVHSEHFRSAVVSPLLHFEGEQLRVLGEERCDMQLEEGEGTLMEPDELSILPDSVWVPSKPPGVANDKPGTSDSTEHVLDTPSARPPAKRISSSTAPLNLMPILPVSTFNSSISNNNAVPHIESVQSLSPTMSGYYDECDQLGNIIANYMRRLSYQDRLEFHCHIMSCTKDFFNCCTRFNGKQRP
ncbi:hypothetical protein HPB52_012570 [Rhipicephalus sanguineus]|uniref:MADF domain-containing protein n=1 Tax=Rhipicephalus sanguineus TaxID=34632 RepID=A0A9D4T9X3_RHISA|nr:hypothetical protein HPB52_012570 [Rhipicephalus sanguineus]